MNHKRIEILLIILIFVVIVSTILILNKIGYAARGPMMVRIVG